VDECVNNNRIGRELLCECCWFFFDPKSWASNIINLIWFISSSSI